MQGPHYMPFEPCCCCCCCCPQVVAVDCGGTAPTLHNLAALPQPDAAIWPQLVFDMRYEGE